LQKGSAVHSYTQMGKPPIDFEGPLHVWGKKLLKLKAPWSSTKRQKQGKKVLFVKGGKKERVKVGNWRWAGLMVMRTGCNRGRETLREIKAGGTQGAKKSGGGETKKSAEESRRGKTPQMKKNRRTRNRNPVVDDEKGNCAPKEPARKGGNRSETG